jgi:1-acyl-sn-glycerol-3-phosphate acyltransferase
MPLDSLPEPERPIDKLRGIARGLPTSLVLFSTLLAFNMIQLGSLVVRVFSGRAFRAINRWGANTWWGWCVWWAEKLYGLKVSIYGDKVPLRENVLVVANHQQMTDINLLMSFARRKERLGDMKWLVKDIVKWVPGVGWGMLFLDCPFIKRDWAKDRDTIYRTFHHLLDHKTPTWLISFAEGTRLTKKKLEVSRDYAKACGMELMEHLLVPRTKGFVASVQALGGHIDAVYDVTIGYVRGVPTLWQFIKGYVRQVHLHVRRFAIEDLPHEEKVLAQWLIDRYHEKDKLLAYYYANGSFPGNALDEPLF